MASLDPERLLAMLRDPNVESREIAEAAGVPREEAGRASRLLLGIAKAKPEEAAALAAPLAKDVAKEAKRGLHVLRTRGVAVPEPPPRAAPAAPQPAPEPPLPA